MAYSIENSSIENLLSQINIVDVIGSVVQLKRSGSNYKGVCPFHNEKTPSFVVSEQKQIFTCFGCGATGNVIKFVMLYYNMGFVEAVEKLADEYGIKLERNTYGENLDVYYDANRLAARFFYKSFTEKANKGYSYMKRREISPSTLKRFGIGYADENWTSLVDFLSNNGVEKKTMLELGLAAESKGRVYDKFRNRVMFPIINTSGKVIGFGGRAIDSNDNPKYLNSPESKVFKKKNNLYGLNITRENVGKEGYIILVEGYMDTIALYQSGVQNVVASLGTALTDNQARLIKRYTSNVILSYDADQAGQNAALRGMEILRKEDCKVKVLHVTDGKDPDEFVKHNGKKAFLNLIDGALPYGEYRLKAAAKNFDISKDDQKLEYIKTAVKILRELSPVERDMYIKKLSTDINVSEGALRMELSEEKTSQENIPVHDYHKTEEKESLNILPVEKDILRLITRDETFIGKVRENKGLILTDAGKQIFSVLEKDIRENGTLDIVRVLDSLDGRLYDLLCEIMETVPAAGSENEIFAECVRKQKLRALEEEEKKIITMFKLADESNSDINLTDLMNRLKDIQKKIQDERMKG